MRYIAGKRRMRPHLIAGPHWLNLDDLGTHVGKHLPAHRSRNHLRELNYDQIVKCSAAQPRTSQKGKRDYNPKFPNPVSPSRRRISPARRARRID
jgi:hypothetical protein